MAQPWPMDADIQAALADITSTVNFTLAKVLILMNDVQSLRTALTAMASQVSTIAGGLAAQGSQLGDIQTKLTAENTAIGTLGADVQAVADLVAQLRANNPGLPQDVFDTLGAMQTQLNNAAQAAQSSSTSLSSIASSIDSASGVITSQANALATVVAPPQPAPPPAG